MSVNTQYKLGFFLLTIGLVYSIAVCIFLIYTNLINNKELQYLFPACVLIVSGYLIGITAAIRK